MKNKDKKFNFVKYSKEGSMSIVREIVESGNYTDILEYKLTSGF